MSWQPEADEIAQRRAWSQGEGNEESLNRYRAQGWKTVRERIALLADPDTFQEVGQLAGSATYKNGEIVHVTPSAFMMGLGDINGRPVVIGGDDFSVRGGSSGGYRPKGGHNGFSGDLAFEYQIPLINLYHGAGGSVSGVRKRGHALYPGSNSSSHFVELLGRVPVVSAVMGSCAGGPAGREEATGGRPGLGLHQQSDSAPASSPRDVTIYEMSGVDRSDVDALYTYDAMTSNVWMTLERFGFCKAGEAWQFVNTGAIAPGGSLPVNTNGGLLSEAHVSGWNHVCEMVRQLRGECGERQVPGAEILQWASNRGDSFILRR